MTVEEKKRFGLWTLTFLVIANMVGAGVYTTSGFTLGDLKSPAVVILAWGAGGIIALAGAYSYGLLVRAIPESGGEYLFLSRSFHPLTGFIAGWISLVSGFTGAIAFAATAFETYLFSGVARPSWIPEDLAAISVVVVCGIYHGYRPRLGAIIQNFSVTMKLVFLFSFVFITITSLSTIMNHLDTDFSTPVPLETGSMIYAFAGALVWISLSYSGFNAAIYVAEEVQDAEKVIPRSLVLGTGIVMILYLLLNTVFVYSAPVESLVGRKDIAVVSAEELGGNYLAQFVRLIISVSLFTSVSSMMMAAPRVYSKMSEDGFLPAFFQFRNGSPAMAALAEVFLASLLILFSTLYELIGYLSLTLLLCSTLTVGTLFSPAMRGSLTSMKSKLIPVFYILASLLSAVLMIMNDPSTLIGTAVTLVAGLILYGMMKRMKRNPA